MTPRLPCRQLDFVEPTATAFVAAIAERQHQGCRSIWLGGLDSLAVQIIVTLREGGNAPELWVDPSWQGPLPEGVGRGGSGEADLVVLTETDGERLAKRLFDFVDAAGVHLLAPITDCFFRHLPLWLISIPKAGTHLLFQLVTALGYAMNRHFRDWPAGGGAYYPEFDNAHVVAKDFFVDSVRRAPHGNRHHPFPCFPALFIYRNPLDILTSEANYYHQHGKTLFSGYLSGLAPRQRLERLLDDTWLLGTIRDRVGGFAPWLEFPNVIPISFEELVGDRGGGSDQAQASLIWSLQLKLQVPGRPEHFAERLFNPHAETFRAGRIGGHRQAFDPALLRRFAALPQDFMERFGYQRNGEGDGYATWPSRIEEFRRRPLGLQPSDEGATPILVEHDFIGFNLVYYQRRYYAIPLQLGMDLNLGADITFALLPNEERLSRLKHSLVVGPRHLERIDRWRDHALSQAIKKTHVSLRTGHCEEDPGTLVNHDAPYLLQMNNAPELIAVHCNFNIIRHRGRFFGVRHGVPMDWERSLEDLIQSTPTNDLLRGPDKQSIVAQIDQLVAQERMREHVAMIPKDMPQRLDTVTQRLDTVTQRLDTVTQWFDIVNQQLDALKQRIEEVANRQPPLKKLFRIIWNKRP